MASGPVKIQGLVRFGEDFELDLASYKLRRAGRVLKLERIPLEVLAVLVEQPGQIVTREHLVERIWGKDAFLDTDNSINGAIRKIRKVLKDDAEQPRFILTITGMGYRFIAPLAESKAESEPAGSTPQPYVAEPVIGKSPRRQWQVALGIALGLAVAAGIGLRYSRIRPLPSSDRVMLAVLPFDNLTGDAGQDYFSEGMTEELITQVGGLDPKHLGVVARTSVMHYKNSQQRLAEVGRELGVQCVLVGTVRREADRVRITAQLIQVKDQTHIWVREYDRELRGLLTLQGEIAHEIADEIQLTLSDQATAPVRQSAPSPQTYEAYDLYLRGRYFWNKRTIEGFQQAINYFQQATAKDPNYARAYAGLADSYALLGGYSAVPQAELMAEARAAAERALQLDDSSPEAHTALALIVQNYDHDWQTAEREFHRAIDLNPNYATAHHWYAEHLAWRGRFDEALVEIERARQLDPLSLIIAVDYGVILYYSRQYDRALAQFRAVLEMDPNFAHASMIAWVYIQKGMFAEALSVNARLPENSPWHWSGLAYMHGRSGRPWEAQHACRSCWNSTSASPWTRELWPWPTRVWVRKRRPSSGWKLPFRSIPV
jgi:TolB-like protein/DNA-binding winged helix-turn-helix (wHTH) protein/lipoprotein NlpI